MAIANSSMPRTAQTGVRAPGNETGAAPPAARPGTNPQLLLVLVLTLIVLPTMLALARAVADPRGVGWITTFAC